MRSGLSLFVMLLASVVVSLAFAEPAMREVVEGISTSRVVPGEPYDLQGKRVVFTNWHFVQPGDLDWRDPQEKSVYVHGNSELFEAHHVGIRAPRGIKITVRKPAVIGPFDNMPYRCILQDSGIYKGWTSSEYYESQDGMQWEKKANLVLDAPASDGVYQVFIDPSAPAEERYKAVWVGTISKEAFDTYRANRPDGWEPRALLHYGETGEVSAIRGSVSPDGVHWRTLPDPIVAEYADTLNTAYYDPVLRQYVMYTRQWSLGERARALPSDIRNSWTGVGRRAVGRSATDDFATFPVSEMILEPAPDMPPSEQIYTNCRTTIPGAPDHHLMFPALWNASVDDTTRIAVVSSHDGKLWHWVPGGDILYTQPFGRWDGGCIWTLPNLIELPDGDWALPYLGHNVPHKYPRGKREGGMGYAVWPKGRMIALEAENSGGFTMIPVLAEGRTLKVNAVTHRTGWVKVSVAGKDRRAMNDCIPIVGDHPWVTVQWKEGSDLGVEPGQPVTLQFEMYQADLFGVEFD